jgi:O-antigen ligase
MKTPHNFILKELLNYGIIGGAYVVAMWFLPLVLFLRRVFFTEPGPGPMSILLAAGLGGFLVHSLFHSSTNWVYLWLLWALTIISLRLEGEPWGTKFRRLIPVDAGRMLKLSGGMRPRRNVLVR